MLIGPLTPEIIEKRRQFWRNVRGIPGWLGNKTQCGVTESGNKSQRALKWIWRKKWSIALWMLAVAFVAHSALNIYASTLLNRELTAIRQKGEPLQLSELAPPAVPNAQNAAPLYKQAFDSLQLSGEEKGSLGTRAGNRSPQQNLWIEAAVIKNRKAVELTRRAGLMPKCLFPINWNGDPMSLIFPYYQQLRQLARLLGAQAQLEARQGNKAAALRDVRALYGMSDHLSNEPNLIGFLVAQNIESIAEQTLVRVLDSTPLNFAEAQSFQSSLPKTDWNRAFRHSLLSERTFGIYVFETVSQSPRKNLLRDMMGDSAPIWASYPLVLGWKPILKLDQVQTLRVWRQTLDPPFYQQFPSDKKLGALDRAMESTPKYALLSRILLPIFGRASVNRDRAVVRQREREVALALSVYREAKGNYPIQLSQVAPFWKKPLPLDPYNQKPFLYRLDKQNGFALYSIGPNRRDDGGKDAIADQAPGGQIIIGDDIVWGAAKR